MMRCLVTFLLELSAFLLMGAWGGNGDLSRVLCSRNALPESEAVARIDSVLHADAHNAKKLLQLLNEAEKLLASPGEPSHNEVLWLHTLEAVAQSHALSDTQKMRPKALLDIARRNAPGSTAAELTLMRDNGEELSLSQLKTQLVLLYFNDPDCEACQFVKQRLDTTQLLREMAQKGMLTVVAVYTGDDVELWQKNKVPEYVLNTHDHNFAIENDEAYVIPTVPLFYLLDSHRTVLLKNEPSLNRVIEKIKATQPQGGS